MLVKSTGEDIDLESTNETPMGFPDQNGELFTILGANFLQYSMSATV